MNFYFIFLIGLISFNNFITNDTEITLYNLNCNNLSHLCKQNHHKKIKLNFYGINDDDKEKLYKIFHDNCFTLQNTINSQVKSFIIEYLYNRKLLNVDLYSFYSRKDNLLYNINIYIYSKKEYIFVRQIYFIGNYQFSDFFLKSIINILEYHTYDVSYILQYINNISNIIHLYNEKGFYLCKINYTFLKFNSVTIDILFNISEGKKLIINLTYIEGNKIISNNMISKILNINHNNYYLNNSIKQSIKNLECSNIIQSNETQFFSYIHKKYNFIDLKYIIKEKNNNIKLSGNYKNHNIYFNLNVFIKKKFFINFFKYLVCENYIQSYISLEKESILKIINNYDIISIVNDKLYNNFLSFDIYLDQTQLIKYDNNITTKIGYQKNVLFNYNNFNIKKYITIYKSLYKINNRKTYFSYNTILTYDDLIINIIPYKGHYIIVNTEIFFLKEPINDFYKIKINFNKYKKIKNYILHIDYNYIFPFEMENMKTNKNKFDLEILYTFFNQSLKDKIFTSIFTNIDIYNVHYNYFLNKIFNTEYSCGIGLKFNIPIMGLLSIDIVLIKNDQKQLFDFKKNILINIKKSF
ncbi:MAG: hypothetical protein IR527_00550 [Bacteroides sp.]|nr:MAG: hypothetical protein IR527_00550 [Bacteroides sp.]